MENEKLGPMPEPEAEPGETNPGGADAINEDAPFAGDESIGRDLDPDRNPQIEEHVPDEVTDPDAKQQEPADDESSETEEPPA